MAHPEPPALIAAAAAYAEVFQKMPPEDPMALDRQLEDLPADIRTCIEEALYRFSLDAFHRAVRKSLVTDLDRGTP